LKISTYQNYFHEEVKGGLNWEFSKHSERGLLSRMTARIGTSIKEKKYIYADKGCGVKRIQYIVTRWIVRGEWEKCALRSFIICILTKYHFIIR
jgi:hypothetical protein